jgi:hypothetical protein
MNDQTPIKPSVLASYPRLDVNTEADDQELNEILAKGTAPEEGVWKATINSIGGDSPESDAMSAKSSKEASDVVQWTSGNDRDYFPARRTVGVLPPGVYEINVSPEGLYFSRLSVNTENILRFEDTSSDLIYSEIQKFWGREDIFKEYGIAYKRGILMWGPPGAGKTSVISLLCQDIVRRGGIAVKFGHPSTFLLGMRYLRLIEPDKPIVVLMEDIDTTLRQYSETDVLNILDGVDRLNRVVYLATTNYPELLGARIINRPSRFDKRFKIDYPNAASRRMYLEHLVGERSIPQVDLDRWVRDTVNFSVAHLKELFTAVVILDDPYESALATLKTMKTMPKSGNDGEGRAGLRGDSGTESGSSFSKSVSGDGDSLHTEKTRH